MSFDQLFEVFADEIADLDFKPTPNEKFNREYLQDPSGGLNKTSIEIDGEFYLVNSIQITPQPTIPLQIDNLRHHVYTAQSPRIEFSLDLTADSCINKWFHSVTSGGLSHGITTYKKNVVIHTGGSKYRVEGAWVCDAYFSTAVECTLQYDKISFV